MATMKQAQAMVGSVVQSNSSDIWGVLEYVTPGGWAGVRGPKLPSMERGRLDEIQVERIEADPT